MRRFLIGGSYLGAVAAGGVASAQLWLPAFSTDEPSAIRELALPGTPAPGRRRQTRPDGERRPGAPARPPRPPPPATPRPPPAAARAAPPAGPPGHSKADKPAKPPKQKDTAPAAAAPASPPAASSESP